MLDGRSCVVPRLFYSSCQAENDWSYMKYLLDLDIKNGKRPMEIDDDAGDEPKPRKCTKIFDSFHMVETVQISFQQQSLQAEDSVVVPQMDQQTIEPLSICQGGQEEAGACNDVQLLAEQEKQLAMRVVVGVIGKVKASSSSSLGFLDGNGSKVEEETV